MDAPKPDIVVNVIGETCPIPLVEMRKAVMKASPGQVIEVIGSHGSSRKEIPLAVESLGLELLSNTQDAGGAWHLMIRKN
jgi:TusA-related sulfurtransferase